jgi:hypothetical protein
VEHRESWRRTSGTEDDAFALVLLGIPRVELGLFLC